mgnify:CR=1 FL=1
MKDLINVFIIFIVFMCILIVYKNVNSELIEVTSLINNKKYMVRNLSDKQDAADMLARIHQNIEKIINNLNKDYPNDERVKRLKDNFKDCKFSELISDSSYTSYSVNKGEKIVFCIRQKDENESLIDENTITFVAIHELAHVMTKSIGHTPEFWDNFKRLLNEAININVYEKVDYSKDPKEYCGIKVTDSPLY